MAGMGKRFLKVGYQTPKPLIPVDGLPVIEHIVRNFSPEDDFVFGVNEEHEKDFRISETLKKLAPRSKIVFMPYQPEGVVEVVRRMLPYAGEDEPVVVNYCDFSWSWDYSDFKKQVRDNACDGAVICYRGFHPHLLGPNLYATLDAEGLWMKELREKFSWYGNKQEDWTSSGTYYFRKGSDLKKAVAEIERHPQLKIHGEFYISQLFQLMKEASKNIFIYEVPFMLQWGTPEDLEQYQYWSRYFRRKRSPSGAGAPSELTVLILMAGAGKRFSEAGYELPKPFIPVDGAPLVVRATEDLPRGSRYLFVTRKEIRRSEPEATISRVFPHVEMIEADRLTDGQAATALLAKDRLDLGAPLLIGACDHSILYAPDYFARMTAQDSPADALIFTYRNNPMVRFHPEMYGWVETDPHGRAGRVSVKIPLPGDPAKHHAIVGAFWFRKARYFTEQAEAMIHAGLRIRHEFYIDECMNFLIRKGLRVDVFEVDQYVSWGTPEDLRTYEYWQKFFSRSMNPVRES